jgi:hypothetical protein
MEDKLAVSLLPARATKTVYFVRHGEVRAPAGQRLRAAKTACDPGPPHARRASR